MRKDYKRHYINLLLRKNSTKTHQSPQFIRHNIVSPALTAHLIHCYQNNLPLSFDVSAFLDLDDNTAVVTISVPHELTYRKNLTNFYEAEETDQ
jgi:hypothetical protein